MSLSLNRRPRLAVAVSLAMALLLVLTTAVVATSLVASGHAVKAIKVATDDVSTSTFVADWLDVPSMTVTMSVPAKTQALFLITFSAQNYCSKPSYCLIRALINGNEVAPGAVHVGGLDVNTNSMQFLASPMPAGTYTITIQYQAPESSGLTLYARTLSVVRSVV